MLYLTTRSDHDTYTAQRALKESLAPDGGLYIPMRFPALSAQEIQILMGKSSPEICAFLINLFFTTRLSAKDVEFALGKHLIRLKGMSHRITIAECWRNPDGDLSRMERILARLAAVDKRQTSVGQWMKVVCRICVLFCLYAQMEQKGQLPAGNTMDVAVPADDYSGPVAAWYARKMGLPIGNILCCCHESDGLWDLLQTGQLRTELVRRKGGAAASGLEQLIRLCLGAQEARQFVSACSEGSLYQVSRGISRPFAGIYASVISTQRITAVISNVYATNGYILSQESAVLYSGLMDYRARTGCSSPALMISQISPVHSADLVATVLAMTADELTQCLDEM